MKIVVLDGYTLNPGDMSWAGFEALGSFACYDRTPPELILQRISDAQAVITNKTPITRETLAACPGIRYIGVLATGYNIVDTVAAKERGIPVCNVPTYGTAAVSQFVFALLLEACHRVGHHSDTVLKSRRWIDSPDYCYWDYPLIELAGLTLGIIGLGKIGRATAAIAQAMGMKVLAFDEYPDRSLESGSLRYAELDELLRASDVISLHCPLFPSTQNMINKDSIAKMKDGVIIINTSRGPLVNEADMCAALDSGKVGCYAADVVSVEPIKEDNPLLKTKSKNLIITPHIAWAPSAARARLMQTAVDNLAAFIAGKPQNVVNP